MIDLMFDIMVLTAISKSLEPLRSDEDNSVPFFADFFEYGSFAGSPIHVETTCGVFHFCTSNMWTCLTFLF